MKITDHCQLCDHQIKDYINGVHCGLTKKRPDFKKTCVKIKINRVAKDKAYELRKKRENHKLIVSLIKKRLVTLTIIAVTSIILGLLIKNNVHTFAIVPYGLIFIGIGIFIGSLHVISEIIKMKKHLIYLEEKFKTVAKIYSSEIRL